MAISRAGSGHHDRFLSRFNQPSGNFCAADSQGVAAAICYRAVGVQIRTAYMLCIALFIMTHACPNSLWRLLRWLHPRQRLKPKVPTTSHRFGSVGIPTGCPKLLRRNSPRNFAAAFHSCTRPRRLAAAMASVRLRTLSLAKMLRK